MVYYQTVSCSNGFSAIIFAKNSDMLRSVITAFFLSISLSLSFAQAKFPAKHKLVVGLVVDQMRWDFLYRFADRYKPNGGFKRLVSQGFSNENTLIPYTPTVTACRHSIV